MQAGKIELVKDSDEKSRLAAPWMFRYGALELKRSYVTHLLSGLVWAVAIAFVSLFAFKYYPAAGPERPPPGPVYGDTIEFELPPLQEKPLLRPPPSVSFDKPLARQVIEEIPVDFVMGTPEAVPEPEVEEKPPEVLTQEQLSAIADMFPNGETLIKSTYLRVEVLTPNGAEEWEVGSNHTIDWKTVSGIPVDSASINYSTNNGATWERVFSPKEEGSSYRWQIPDTPSRRCKMKVTAFAGDRIDSDESDESFSIRERTDLAVQPLKPLKPQEVPGKYRSVIWISLRCCVNRLGVEAQTGNLKGREDIRIERIYPRGANSIISMKIDFEGKAEVLEVIPEMATSARGGFVIWPYTQETLEQRFETLAGLTRVLCEVLQCHYEGI